MSASEWPLNMALYYALNTALKLTATVASWVALFALASLLFSYEDIPVRDEKYTHIVASSWFSYGYKLRSVWAWIQAIYHNVTFHVTIIKAQCTCIEHHTTDLQVSAMEIPLQPVHHRTKLVIEPSLHGRWGQRMRLGLYKMKSWASTSHRVAFLHSSQPSSSSTFPPQNCHIIHCVTFFRFHACLVIMVSMDHE